MAGVHLSGSVAEEGDDHEADHEEHEPRSASVGAVEAGGAVLALRVVLDANDREHAEGHEHGNGEEVLEEGNGWPRADQGDVEVPLEEGTVGLDDGEEQDGEAPHGEEVGDTGNGPLEDLLLTGDFDDLGFSLLCEALESTRSRLARADELAQPEEAATGNRETGDRDPKSEDDPDEHSASVEVSRFPGGSGETVYLKFSE